jgi:hypothetical protein
MAHTRKSLSKYAKKQKAEAEKEEKFQEASKAVTAKKFNSLAAAARYFNVPYYTFRQRHQKCAGPCSKSQIKKQLLNEVQEQTLCKWIRYMGRIGYPLSKHNLCAKVADLSSLLQERMKKEGKKLLPSRNWVNKFLSWHPDIMLKRLTGVDAQCARSFNPVVIARHFQLLADTMKKVDAPWENVYNMDKKGIQVGRGRKLDNTKFLYTEGQCVCMKVQNANLELITAIECVAVDGSNLKPGFIFSGKNVLHEGYFEEDSML